MNVASFAVQTHCQCSASVAVWCGDIDKIGNVRETWRKSRSFYYIFVQFLVFEIGLKDSKGSKDLIFRPFQPRAGFPRGGGEVKKAFDMWSNLNLEPGPSGPQPNAGYTRQSQILAKLLNPLTPDLLQITMLILCNLLSKCCYTKHISNLTVMEIKAHFCIVIFIK